MVEMTLYERNEIYNAEVKWEDLLKAIDILQREADAGALYVL
jgi:hypothetical protein